jgi:hypothetical protein
MASDSSAGNPRDESTNQTHPPSSSKTRPLIGIVILIVLLLSLLALWAGKNMGGTKFSYHYVNGKPDKEWVYEHGHLVQFLQDRNLDGKWDYWVHYDENGQITDVEYDNNFDGKPDESWTYSNGLPVSVEKDTDFNYTSDEFYTYKDGILQQVEFRPNGSSFATQRWLYQNGVLFEILRGGDTNGHFAETVRFDPFANPIATNSN